MASSHGKKLLVLIPSPNNIFLCVYVISAPYCKYTRVSIWYIVLFRLLITYGGYLLCFVWKKDVCYDEFTLYMITSQFLQYYWDKYVQIHRWEYTRPSIENTWYTSRLVVLKQLSIFKKMILRKSTRAGNFLCWFFVIAVEGILNS